MGKILGMPAVDRLAPMGLRSALIRSSLFRTQEEGGSRGQLLLHVGVVTERDAVLLVTHAASMQPI
jgi:hypothetical protein